MKDLPTRYWLEENTTNLDLERNLKTKVRSSDKFAMVTIHDVCPQYVSKINRIMRRLDKLDIPYSIAVIPMYNEAKDNDIRNDKSFIDFLLKDGKEFALHGFYHERNGNVEEFGSLTKKQAKGILSKGLTLFKKTGIGKTKIFIPPTWAVNKQTIEALENLKFEIIETEEEVILLGSLKSLLIFLDNSCP